MLRVLAHRYAMKSRAVTLLLPLLFSKKLLLITMLMWSCIGYRRRWWNIYLCCFKFACIKRIHLTNIANKKSLSHYLCYTKCSIGMYRPNKPSHSPRTMAFRGGGVKGVNFRKTGKPAAFVVSLVVEGEVTWLNIKKVCLFCPTYFFNTTPKIKPKI